MNLYCIDYEKHMDETEDQAGRYFCYATTKDRARKRFKATSGHMLKDIIIVREVKG